MSLVLTTAKLNLFNITPEGEYIRATECVNKQGAGRTHKQYYEENKDICIPKCREYNTNNREKTACIIKEYARKHKREVQE